MKQTTDEIARWLGILDAGILVGHDAERAVERAAKVLGEARLGELRAWFQSSPPGAVRAAKIAVIEAAVAVAQADREVAEPERELVERIVQLAGLDDAAKIQVFATLEKRAGLEDLKARIAAPALAELTLALAWQMAAADDHVEESERGVYGELAKRLGIEPERAKALRTLAE
jgi:tellurite resistance protein